MTSENGDSEVLEAPPPSAEEEENGDDDFEFGNFETANGNDMARKVPTASITSEKPDDDNESEQMEESKASNEGENSSEAADGDSNGAAENGDNGGEVVENEEARPTTEEDESSPAATSEASTEMSEQEDTAETAAHSSSDMEPSSGDFSVNSEIEGSTTSASTEPDRKPPSSKVPAKGEEEEPEISKVEAQVCEAFFEWTAAWNEGNLFGYLDGYWDSEETRYISAGLAHGPHAKGGVVITGRRDIDKIFTEIFVKNKKLQEKQKIKKGVAGLLTLRKLLVTPTGVDNAVVYGEHLMELAGDKKGHPRGGVFTIHVRKMEDKWKIISEHATELPKK